MRRNRNMAKRSNRMAKRSNRRVYTDAQRRQFCNKWKMAQKQGCTFTMFCKQVKLSPTTMRNWLKKFNMAMPSSMNSMKQSAGRKKQNAMRAGMKRNRAMASKNKNNSKNSNKARANKANNKRNKSAAMAKRASSRRVKSSSKPMKRRNATRRMARG